MIARGVRTSHYMSVPTSDFEDEEGFADDFIMSHQMQKPGPGMGGAARLLESPKCQGCFALLILANSAVIGLETDLPDSYHWDFLEHVFLVIFTLELALRMAVFGPAVVFSWRREDFGWNLFDAVVIAIGVVDALTGAMHGDKRRNGGEAMLLRIVRLLRVLRILRIIRFLKQLYLLAYGLAEAAKAIMSVSLLMMFLLYVCSILLVRTLGQHAETGDQHYMFLARKFGNIPVSMFSLFELMTAPDLPEYANQSGLLQAHPALTCFLVSFVIFGSFGMIALLTGVINETMFEKNQLKIDEERREREHTRSWFAEKCKVLFRRLPLDEDRNASAQAVANLVPKIERLFDAIQVDYLREELRAIVYVMDTDGDGSISEEEFCRTLVNLAGGVRSATLQELYHAVCILDSKVCRMQKELLETKAQCHPGKIQELVRQLTGKVDGLLQSQREVTADVAAIKATVAARGRGPFEERSAAALQHLLQEEPRDQRADAAANADVTRLWPGRPSQGGGGDSLLRPLDTDGLADTAAWLTPLLEGAESRLRERLGDVLCNHAGALAKVAVLEAQAMAFSEVSALKDHQDQQKRKHSAGPSAWMAESASMPSTPCTSSFVPARYAQGEVSASEVDAKTPRGFSALGGLLGPAFVPSVLHTERSGPQSNRPSNSGHAPTS